MWKELRDRWKSDSPRLFRWITELRDRWKSDSPRLFRWITRVGSGIAAISLAVHLAVVGGGGVEPYWWTNIYPYLIGIPAGMAAVAKLTRENKEDKEDDTRTKK